MRNFKILSYIEGASLLLLFFVAMPLKYLAGMPEAVRIVGTIHGVLFVMFVVSSLVIGRQFGWTIRHIVMSWVIASIPFGPWIFERKLFGINASG
jgi:integral membrane protein